MNGSVQIQSFRAALTDTIKKRMEKFSGLGKLDVFVLAQEGESRPTSLSSGPVSLHWPRMVIQALSTLVKKGTKLFVGHKEGTNSHKDRPSFGEVVDSFLDYVDGKLSNVIIGKVKEPGKFDTISMEADIQYSSLGNENFEVERINKVTGVALGMLSTDTPGFSGARKLMTIQAFTENEQHKKKEGLKKMEITFKQVEDFMRENKVFPRQVGISLKEVKNDNVLWEEVTRHFSDTMGEKEKAWVEEKKKMESELLKYRAKEGLIVGKELLEKRLKVNTADAVAVFIRKRFDENPTTDWSEEGINKFVAEGEKAFKEYQPIFKEPAQSEPPDTQTKKEDDVVLDVINKVLKGTGDQE